MALGSARRERRNPSCSAAARTVSRDRPLGEQRKGRHGACTAGWSTCVPAFTGRFAGTPHCRGEAGVMTQPRRVLLLPVAALVLLGPTMAVASNSAGGHLGWAHAGRQPNGSVITSTGQRLTPAGHQL